MTRNAVGVVCHLRALFVDDGRMALAVLAWLALGGSLSWLGEIPPAWRGPVLLAGLVFLLSWGCLKSARRRT